MLSKCISEIKEIAKYKNLIRNLVAKDMRVKYRNSVFGYIWSLMNPLVLIGTYVFVFKYLLRLGERQDYVIMLIVGVLFWQYFSAGLKASSRALVVGGNLFKKVKFPRIIPLISILCFNLIEHLLTYPFIIIALWYFKCPVNWALVWFIPLFIMLNMFLFGAGLFLGTVNVFFRDIVHMLEVVLRILFWTTPIIYTIDRIPERFQWIIKLTPMTPFLISIKQVLCLGKEPSGDMLLQCLIYSVAALFLGLLVYHKYQDHFVEEL